jgi:hypothetical protein
LLILVLLAPADALAEEPVRADVPTIQKRLDRKVKPTTVTRAALVDVLKSFEGSDADWMELPAATIACLPYGRKQPVAFKTNGKETLRELLERLLEPVSLTMRIEDIGDGKAVLRIVPMPELRRIGRRAAIEELEILRLLRAEQVKSSKLPLRAQIQQAVGQKLLFSFDVGNQDYAAAVKELDRTTEYMQAMPFAEALDQFCAERRWAWRLDRAAVRVVDRPRQVVHQLRRTVTVHWDDLPVDEALIELGNAAGVLVQFQPALMEGLEERNRRLSWSTQGISVLQTIETVSARTGLAYEVREESLYFHTPRGGSWRTDPIIGMVELPTPSGASCRMFLRKSMLPEDVHPLLEAALKQAADELAVKLRSQAKSPADNVAQPE